MTKAQRQTISSPAMGLIVYQTDEEQGLYNYNGTDWVKVTDGTVPETGIIISETKSNPLLTATGFTYFGEETRVLEIESAVAATAESWIATSTSSAPSHRIYHSALWTGTKMIIWGGFFGGKSLNTGGIYDPLTNDSNIYHCYWSC